MNEKASIIKYLKNQISEIEGNKGDDQIAENFIANYSIKPKRQIDIVDDNGPEYHQPKMTEMIDTKIKRLRKIAKSIESKVISKENYPEKIQKTKIDYQKELNPSQFYAATITDGPLLVIAGAGTGKTRALTYRVSYLLEQNVDPASILLLTFTRKAANEMISRTTTLLKNNRAEHIMGGTFHAFANHVLRKYANLLQIKPNFTVIDTSDSEDIIALIRDENKFPKKERAFPKKSRVQEIISKSRNCQLPISKILEREFTGLLIYVKELNLIASIYDKYKKANQIFDYDDLIEFMNFALKDNLQFRMIMQDTFRYIMVDEYQDTNIPQKELVNLLAEKHRNVMVVGDDSQSIYAFRGANFENILTFPEVYPDCKVVKIEENYRSNTGILNFTNQIIENAKIGYKKILFSQNKNIVKPVVRKFYRQEDEAEYVVDRVLESREQGIALDDIAVLYRASYQGNRIQAELLRRDIPYVVVGGIKFIERRHVRDVIAFLRVVLNPYDAPAWHRILKMVPGVGEMTAKKIIGTIHNNNGRLEFSEFEKKKFHLDLKCLQGLMKEITDVHVNLAQKIKSIKDYYKPIIKLLESDYEIRLLDVDFLYNLALKYKSLEKFLTDFALDPPSTKFQSETRPKIDEAEERPLTLSTVHSAKGLEWHTVFIPHLLDGLFPSVKSMKNIEELEEERRLFYVATTRAKENLYITMPSYFASWDAIFTLPSRFLTEIDEECWIYDE
ncbi:ATP-dependent helicase [Candidatus Margulisiibacteriota bacterium]